MIKSRFLSIIFFPCLLAMAALALSACDCATCVEGQDEPYIRMAPMAPPPPVQEQMPVLENLRGTIWRPGYWQYGDGDFYWVDGEVIARPGPTAVWSPDHWIKHTYGWAFVPGYWQ